MANRFSQVPDAIRGLGSTISQIAADDIARRTQAAQFGLQEKQLELTGAAQTAEGELKVAQAEREKFLDTPMTMTQAASNLLQPKQLEQVAGVLSLEDPTTGTPFADAMTTPRQFQKSFGEFRNNLATIKQKEADRVSSEASTAARIASSEKIAGERIKSQEEIARQNRALKTSMAELDQETNALNNAYKQGVSRAKSQTARNKLVADTRASFIASFTKYNANAVEKGLEPLPKSWVGDQMKLVNLGSPEAKPVVDPDIEPTIDPKTGAVRPAVKSRPRVPVTPDVLVDNYRALSPADQKQAMANLESKSPEQAKMVRDALSGKLDIKPKKEFSQRDEKLIFKFRDRMTGSLSGVSNLETQLFKKGLSHEEIATLKAEAKTRGPNEEIDTDNPEAVILRFMELLPRGRAEVSNFGTRMFKAGFSHAETNRLKEEAQRRLDKDVNSEFNLL